MANFDALYNWILERAWKDTTYTTEFRGLTLTEQGMIDLSVTRMLATNRRIETKLLEIQREDEHVLDALCWD